MRTIHDVSSCALPTKCTVYAAALHPGYAFSHITGIRVTSAAQTWVHLAVSDANGWRTTAC